MDLPHFNAGGGPYGASPLPMALPQGSQRTLEALQRPLASHGGVLPGGVRASPLGTVTKSCVRLTEGAPVNQAEPDGGRWLSVGKDATGGYAGRPWMTQALARRIDHSTVLDKPFPSLKAAARALHNPAKAAAQTRASPGAAATAVREGQTWRDYVTRTYGASA